MRQFILGTDWWTDCDDAVALRLLVRAHKNKEIRLLGIGLNACMEYSVTSAEGFLNSEGVCDIPIGIDFEVTDFGGEPPYQERLSKLAQTYSNNRDAEDAVKLYRRILANADSPIELIEIGFPQVLSNLLQSTADEISQLTGMELVKKQVSKIWMMAGRWDKNPGKENNFERNARSRQAAHIFCRICPVPVTFLGWEVGATVISGTGLEKTDSLYLALSDFGSPNGRPSWDPMLCLLAIVGDEAEAGYSVVHGTATVDAQTGENRFVEHIDGLHSYVIKVRNDFYYAAQIDKRVR